MSDKRPVGIGIDPGGGGKTGGTGFAVADVTTGAPVKLLNVRRFDQLVNQLKGVMADEKYDIKVCVIEDYKLDTWRAQQQGGSRMETVQVIGLLKGMCMLKEIPVVIQDRRHRKTGEKWSQIAEPADHSISHMYSAYNHLFYYLVRYHNVPTADERAKGIRPVL